MRKFFWAMVACLPLFAAAEIPRPEYPQPQFQRSQWLNLNGPWEFEFDDQNVGVTEDWANGRHRFGRTITVPYCFESKLSGIADTTFHPWVWYRRSVALPANWRGQRVLLQFGAVDYRAKVWVNGRAAGEHEGGNVPFRFDITPLLTAGANVVTVRAEDPPTDRYIPRGKQYWELKSRSIFYTRTSGIWQTVWLEAVGDSYLEKVRINPQEDGTVTFDSKIARLQPGLELAGTVKHKGKVVSTFTSSLENAIGRAAAAVQDPLRWSVNNPNLYDVTFELRKQGAVLDRVESYFGFRTVAVETGKLVLNHRPTILRLVLDQGYWPESILTPPTDEAIQFDIRVTKEMGFNGARKHQKLEDPRYLYWADKMGFLVSSEMANAYLFDEDYVARFAREWTEAVDRDYNHPSIVIWVPINESWGTPNLRDPRQQAHLKGMYTLTKSLDSTRLVIDDDGWEHTDMTDLFAVHDYVATGALLQAKYKNIQPGKIGSFVPDNGKAVLAPGYGYNGTPLYLSEFGGISYIAPGSQVPPDAWGYAGVEKTEEDATARLKGLFAAMDHFPGLIGYCYTQLTDVEQEINGLLTYDRKPKFDFGKLREYNRHPLE